LLDPWFLPGVFFCRRGIGVGGKRVFRVYRVYRVYRVCKGYKVYRVIEFNIRGRTVRTLDPRIYAEGVNIIIAILIAIRHLKLKRNEER
jgi:hypothetical protein